MFPVNLGEALSGGAGCLRSSRSVGVRVRFVLALVVVVQAVGCGAPGLPLAPHPPVPATIPDLAATQLGDGVLLTFTLPKKQATGEALENPPEVEILREIESTSASAEAGTPKAPSSVAYTIPPGQTAAYVSGGQMRFLDSLSAAQIRQVEAGRIVYAVRTNVSKRVAAAPSNLVVVVVRPAAEPVGDLSAEVTRKSIELKWTAPGNTTGGEPMPAIGSYHVYRGEVAMGAEAAAAASPPEAKLEEGMALLGVAAAPSYSDGQFEFGRAYIYSVRSVAEYDSGQVESADSNLTCVWARDTFAPGAPRGLAAVLVPAAAGESAHIELSWAVGAETNIAGYNVYRKGVLDAQWKRLNGDLLPVPVFRDMSAEPGHAYSYAVAAVSQMGVESERSAEVAATMSELTGGQP
jgi:hypothetical protein